MQQVRNSHGSCATVLLLRRINLQLSEGVTTESTNSASAYVICLLADLGTERTHKKRVIETAAITGECRASRLALWCPRTGDNISS